MAGIIMILILVGIYTAAQGTALKRPCYEEVALAGRDESFRVAGNGMWRNLWSVKPPGSAGVLPALKVYQRRDRATTRGRPYT